MSTVNAVVAVGTSATNLLTDVTDDEGVTWVRQMLIANESSVDIYLGGPNVTTANGIKLPAGDRLVWELVDGSEPRAVVGTGTADLHIMHDGV
jgi:hypothetical protein